MAFNNSYGFVFLRAVDLFWASLVWRDYAVTISSMTGLELRKPAPKRWARILGWCLNHLQAGHCEAAIAADLTRAYLAIKILEGRMQP
jgi:hypothetical protein